MFRHWLMTFATFCAVAVTSVLMAQSPRAIGEWDFDGSLEDHSGRASHAFSTTTPEYVQGLKGQALRCGTGAVTVADIPEFHPAPGLRIECSVKFDALTASWQNILMKNGAYQLRLDPPKEGGQFSFFLHLGQWEPRVRSKTAAKPGVWYHLAAGWDGKEIWIEVDGQRTSVPRTGTPDVSGEPIELGQFKGAMDDLRLENPNARFTGAAQWLFDGGLRDTSGRGHDLQGKEARFVPVPGGQALKINAGSFTTADHPDLQLSPGFRINASVRFDPMITNGCMIAIKDGEYQLRVNSAKEGGCFAFFVNLDGWEPRVCSTERVQPGIWYRLSAQWDGRYLTLDVNGQRIRASRSGLPHPSSHPLAIGSAGAWIDNLNIVNPRTPTLLVRRTIQDHAILCAGRPETLRTFIRNIGTPAGNTVIHFELPQGMRLTGPAFQELGAMPAGMEKTVEWTVQASSPVWGDAVMRLSVDDKPAVTARHPLVFFASGETQPDSVSKQSEPPLSTAYIPTIYYIDGMEGNNANSGLSSNMPWRDFTPINGRRLGPGEKLLIRRGSVINQELALSARGRETQWAEIGTYGTGPRPIIRRNWDIADRCALIESPDYLRIRGLVVCHAGNGLVVHYTESGHRGLVIEDCIAHHIEGLYRPNSHGIPEWRNREGAPGDGLTISAGIAIIGATATDLVLRNCDTYQCSSGWFARGNDVLIDRVYCHDNIVHNTSPHPFAVEIRRSILQNSIFDASGWHASAGTMGIMLGNPQGLIIRNCYFRNQPDSGSHDEGGVDFENSGNGCLIDHCTFENNAGAAIEVLGLQSPQTQNIEIRSSRFYKNNTGRKLGPSEIYVWGKVRDPSVCCSSGLIQSNGFVTLPGIEFYTNEAPALTAWTLRDNQAYATAGQLDEEMPYNRPPFVNPGKDIHTDQLRIRLAGKVKDDGLPSGKRLSSTWEVMEGPGPVTFENAKEPDTTATFEQPGDYLLRLSADDGELWLSRLLTVHVLPAGKSIRAAWEFNTNLNKEGWMELNTGTRIMDWPDARWSTRSEPVKYVAGGYYMVAVENSTNFYMISPERMNISLNGNEKIVLRFQNHTPANQWRLLFTTRTGEEWTNTRSVVFKTEPMDNTCRTYTLDMSAVSGWKGQLQQLRLEPATGQPVTGTCRFDYIWITVSYERK